jgi:hypothetical protein
MSDIFQPGDYFVESSPLTAQVIAQGMVLKVATLGAHQLLTVEYEDCPTWLGMSSRTNVVLALWCQKRASKATPEHLDAS